MLTLYAGGKIILRPKLTLFFLFPAISLLLTISFAPARAEAHANICPFNCEESRELTLKNPALTGEDVLGVQKMLHGLGFFNSPSNGVYDQHTYQAVKNFQLNQGLNPDGVVNGGTWETLGRAVEPFSSKVLPPPGGKISIIIDTKRRKLTVFSDGKPYKTFPVALGKHETPTPIGNWKVARKARNWGTGFGTRWLGLNVPWGIYGIHGTNKPYSIGGYQSHGCIRMFNSHVEEMFPWIPAGAPIIIVGNPFNYMEPTYKILRKGDRGAAVMEVQSALQRLGYKITVDGIWGQQMEEVVIKYRKEAHLPFDNSVNAKVYQSLGLK
ncbi:MAG: ErfK/YbiS/YcfS/YnhG family protein [Peptococcaceae bacterium BRH_c4b]|nr:MAG: ErfK/YbiS/YcfS/YnhG family protein [Peptococcaceae bacterium BRH_c4b]